MGRLTRLEKLAEEARLRPEVDRLAADLRLRPDRALSEVKEITRRFYALVDRDLTEPEALRAVAEEQGPDPDEVQAEYERLLAEEV